MSHTPGPWTYDPYANDIIKPGVVSLEDDGGCSDPECCGGASYHVEIKKDDAVLIAAAPDILESLKEAINRLRNQSPQSQLTYQLNDMVIAKAEAAIAKAEGKP